MTIPNVNTTRSAVYRQILAEVITATAGNAATVFIAGKVIWLDTIPGDWYIELVPGAAQDKHAKHPIGWADDTFSLCIFKRLYVDQAAQDTARIADATNGLLTLVATAEAIVESYLKGLALVPILPDRTEATESDPNDPNSGWVMVRRFFKLEWLYAMPGAHSTS